jgi:hypothetical protein
MASAVFSEWGAEASEGAKGDKEGVVHGVGIVQKDPNDFLDAPDAGGI